MKRGTSTKHDIYVLFGGGDRLVTSVDYNLLNFKLEEWMPWYTQSYDFSLLEVNRFVQSTVLVLYMVQSHT